MKQFEKLDNLLNYHKKQIENLSPEEKQVLENEFEIRFIYESNAIEGNPLTYEEVKNILKE